MRKLRWVLVAVFALVVAACGGGDDDSGDSAAGGGGEQITVGVSWNNYQE